jgi:hypothetical protein
VLDAPNMIQMVGNFGFPIAITVYLLIRFENRLDGLKAAIDNLAKNIAGIERNKG